MKKFQKHLIITGLVLVTLLVVAAVIVSQQPAEAARTTQDLINNSTAVLP